MTMLDSTPPAEETAIPMQPLPDRIRRLDSWLERIGEWLNPILVKECRQALKGKQFSITFGLVLLCVWLWSIAGVALIGPQIFYSFNGPDMFYGYYLILAFPLIVIVPYGAFRSLASECEDRTFELLSITTLRPRQIISGKLASAVLQMLVYFSAVSPCLAFTYMLRGVDMLTILTILIYTFLASLALSLVSLLIATVTNEKHWQIVLSVALVLGLAGLFFMACGLSYAMITEGGYIYQEPEFWLVNGAILTAYVSYFVLLYLTAAAQLTFASDNRSTPVRVVMLTQQFLFTAWMAWGAFQYGDEIRGRDVTIFSTMYLIFVGLHWYAMGIFLTAESPALSPRVKRQLPQSFMGRTFLTWFNPGPGTGYLFCLVNLAGAIVLACIALAWWSSRYWSTIGPGGWGPEPMQVYCLAAVGFGYVAGYLGLGLLIVTALRRYFSAGPLLTLLLQIVLLLVFCGVPLVIHLMSDFRGAEYNLLHVANPIWSAVELVDRTSLPIDGPVIAMFVLPIAGLIVLCNLPLVAAEVRHVRIARPKRVQEEDAQLAPPPAPAPTSPWG